MSSYTPDTPSEGEAQLIEIAAATVEEYTQYSFKGANGVSGLITLDKPADAGNLLLALDDFESFTPIKPGCTTGKCALESDMTLDELRQERA